MVVKWSGHGRLACRIHAASAPVAHDRPRQIYGWYVDWLEIGGRLAVRPRKGWGVSGTPDKLSPTKSLGRLDRACRRLASGTTCPTRGVGMWDTSFDLGRTHYNTSPLIEKTASCTARQDCTHDAWGASFPVPSYYSIAEV